MTAAREQSVSKARKVFALGVSTTYAGEKEICFQRLSKILQQQNMVLFDLDTQLPKRLDLAVLRVKMGLEPAASGRASSTAGGSQSAAGSGRASQQQTRTESFGVRFTSQDPEVVLWTHLSPTERRRLLDSSLFGSLWATVRNTSAYPRLLSALREYDLSSDGYRLGDTFILELVRRTLLRSGNGVSCAYRTQTVFDDLLGFCLAGYKRDADGQRFRQAQQQRYKKEAEAQEARVQREKEEQVRKRREEHARQKAEYWGCPAIA